MEFLSGTNTTRDKQRALRTQAMRPAEEGVESSQVRGSAPLSSGKSESTDVHLSTHQIKGENIFRPGKGVEK